MIDYLEAASDPRVVAVAFAREVLYQWSAAVPEEKLRALLDAVALWDEDNVSEVAERRLDAAVRAIVGVPR